MTTKVFISRPTKIETVFETAYTRFEKYMKRVGLVPCRLGVDNYTLDAPLTAVIDLVKQCSGTITLGYPQYEFEASVLKDGVQEQQVSIRLPTPWNHIEAALAFQQCIPVLVVAHQGVLGGVFDHGVTGQFVLVTDLSQPEWYKQKQFRAMFHEWKQRLK